MGRGGPSSGQAGCEATGWGAGPHPSPHQSTVPGGHGKVCMSPETHSCGHSMSDCYQSGRASGRRAVLRAVISPKVRRPLTEQAPGAGRWTVRPGRRAAVHRGRGSPDGAALSVASSGKTRQEVCRCSSRGLSLGHHFSVLKGHRHGRPWGRAY